MDLGTDQLNNVASWHEFLFSENRDQEEAISRGKKKGVVFRKYFLILKPLHLGNNSRIFVSWLIFKKHRHLWVKLLFQYPPFIHERESSCHVAQFHEGHRDEEDPFQPQGVYSQEKSKERSPEGWLHNPGRNKREVLTTKGAETGMSLTDWQHPSRRQGSTDGSTEETRREGLLTEGEAHGTGSCRRPWPSSACRGRRRFPGRASSSDPAGAVRACCQRQNQGSGREGAGIHADLSVFPPLLSCCFLPPGVRRGGQRVKPTTPRRQPPGRWSCGWKASEAHKGEGRVGTSGRTNPEAATGEAEWSRSRDQLEKENRKASLRQRKQREGRRDAETLQVRGSSLVESVFNGAEGKGPDQSLRDFPSLPTMNLILKDLERIWRDLSRGITLNHFIQSQD